MSRWWIAGAFAVAPLLLGSAAVQAQSSADSKAETMSVEISGQTRLRIYPRRRDGELRPGDLWYYPGPNAVRQCRSWLQRELRPSGPVVTPQMRCWWVPG
jgi:hypothetical protein